MKDFVVLCHLEPGHFICQAENADKAEEAFQAAHPSCPIVWIAQTSDPEVAYREYQSAANSETECALGFDSLPAPVKTLLPRRDLSALEMAPASPFFLPKTEVAHQGALCRCDDAEMVGEISRRLFADERSVFFEQDASTPGFGARNWASMLLGDDCVVLAEGCKFRSEASVRLLILTLAPGSDDPEKKSLAQLYADLAGSHAERLVGSCCKAVAFASRSLGLQHAIAHTIESTSPFLGASWGESPRIGELRHNEVLLDTGWLCDSWHFSSTGVFLSPVDDEGDEPVHRFLGLAPERLEEVQWDIDLVALPNHAAPAQLVNSAGLVRDYQA